MKQAKLPAEYQEVEYISSQSDGKQWIDTGYIITYDTKTIIEGSVLSSNRGSICGVYARGYGIQTYYGAWRTFGYTSYNTPFSSVSNKRTRFELYRNDYTVDGQTFTASIGNIFPSVVGLPLFARRYNGGEAGDGNNVTIYMCDIYESGVLSMSLVPCYRKSDNKPGMYDLSGSICPLTNSPFYINAGTGEFTVGPDVN